MSLTTEDFKMKNYGTKSTFASFLPGIAGMKGIPIWCYYVNRGQGVVSFGVDNKDHAIMEFYPAHLAYQNVKRTGFRTFIRKDSHFLEAFSEEADSQEMTIHMNSLEISEENQKEELLTEVKYFILPEETVGALVRRVTITNLGDKSTELEVLDGMPALIPYGVGMDSMKNMTQTAKAWMQVEDLEQKVPFYRVRASMDDTASVDMVNGGNFALGLTEEGERLTAFVDPWVIFSYDNSLEKPVSFIRAGINGLMEQEENTSNLLPCSFFGRKKALAPGEKMTLYELIGQVENKAILNEFLNQKIDEQYFAKKEERADSLIEEMCRCITTKTGDSRFDAYCRYTYMDNVLRGGFPIRLGHNKIFYVYSRKHGDLERDYNYFSMLPEFYSQGNGNFRDVNQNRRMDVFFAPFIGRENLHTFYSLIQLDGYNPLSVEKVTYIVSDGNADMILKDLTEEKKNSLKESVTQPFTPGKLYEKLAEDMETEQVEKLFVSLIDVAEGTVNGEFNEGYWSDHWDYNLDLIEEYISVFPEKEQEMLYEKEYTCFLSRIKVNPRCRRYEVTEKGIRQYHALDEKSRRDTDEKLVRKEYGKGEVLKVTLMEKLLLLGTVKLATLDPYGMGIEMEGGKPGWYDALNGLPGMLGSSMAETCELARMMNYTIRVLKKYPGQVELIEEQAELMEELAKANMEDPFVFWNQSNDAKETYREKIFDGVSGNTRTFSTEELSDMLENWLIVVENGISKAVDYGNGICPTYFTYEVTDYEENENGIFPKRFELHQVPYFLEGPVRYLKLERPLEEKEDLYRAVKSSDLYDRKLEMYKVNASLREASYELGRARAFTPGWLENESIWLHMEYKYLLELLKSGLYEKFLEDFHHTLIPFLKEETYGRSILENSSFIASSKNPDSKIHGKGFVARLSGSTVEFLNMWKNMMFGKEPFLLRDGELMAQFKPLIPEYLIGTDKKIQAEFLNQTEVSYELAEKKDYIPGNYEITEMVLFYEDGTVTEVVGDSIFGQLAEDLRNGKIKKVNLTIR